MFIPILGLSVFFHLVIIISAKVVNHRRGRDLQSAYQTYGKNGGLVKSARDNKIISYFIVVFVSFYMISLGVIAFMTAWQIGSTEPQIIFVKWLIALVFSGIVFVLLSATFKVILTMSLMAGFILMLRMKRLEIINHLNMVRSNMFNPEYLRMSLQYVSLFVSKFISLPAFALYTLNSLSLILGILVGISLFASPIIASAQIIEPGFESEVVASGFSLATAVAFTPDGRIFVAQKGGSIMIVKEGVLLPQPLVTLTDVNNFGDRGLLGMAVDPNFSTNGYIYVLYSYENTPGVNVAGPKTGRIVRLTVEGDSASESTKLVLVGNVGGTIESPSCEDYAATVDCIPSDSNSHSVGGLRFGPDGKLYATLGDGADFVDVDPRALRAQNVDSLGGKLLRINTDGTAPTDNPFYDGNPHANRSKVYALGLRNAFRFNFHPTTGQLYIGDVGWGTYEEINLGVAGANYGWPCREGNFATSYGCIPSSTATNPLYTYPHNASGAGSITAGAFPSNGVYPSAYDNSLFIADYSQMWMKRLELNASGTSVIGVQDFNTDIFPVDIISGPDGNIYYIDIVFGTLNRLTHTDGNRRPVVSINANPTSGLMPLNVSFSSAGTYDPDGDSLSYAWSFGDGSSASSPNPSHIYTANGTYAATLVVTDSFGSAVAKTTNIYVGNQAPQAQITNPASGSLYNIGGTVTVSGEGFDPEDGILPPSAFSWEVILHHNVHTHTIQQIVGSSTITFPADDHNDSDVYIEVILTVVDGNGLSSEKSINMYLNNGIGSGNLISNPSMEIEGTFVTSPLDWYQNWYGVMNPVFTYPVTGYAGAKAAEITVTNYESGSAKWLSSPAFVTPGERYTFSDLYTANTPTDVIVQLIRTNGTAQYLFLGVVPPVSQPTRNTFTFDVPAGIETATVFHELTSNGTLTIDDFSLTLTNNGDVTPPSGSISSPATNSTNSDIIMVEVEANDNVGVASVQLLVGGNPVGVPDSEGPFVLVWDTNVLTDGEYALSARISDTSGNTTDTPSINVTVDNGNVVLPNLIQNGDFETVNGVYPLGWLPGGWGTLTSEFNYPVPGVGGGSAIEVVITDYEYGDTGDARWVHTSVPVTSGTEYTYRTMYKSNSISDIIGRYTFANGSDHHFGLIKEIQPSTDWTQLEKTFVPPVGAQTITFFHLISSEATLTIDNVEMYATGTGTPSEINAPLVDFVYPNVEEVLSGTVTLVASSSDDTAVVGVYFAVNGTLHGIEDATAPYEVLWDTTGYPDGDYIIKATTHDPYGNNDKVERLVTVDNSSNSTTTGSNLVVNPGLETPGAAGNPANWNRGGWGTNTRTFTYPATGSTGSGAAVTISNYSNGDAKWFFNDVAVTAGTEYDLSNRYNSTVTSNTMIRYTTAGGASQYQFLQTLPSTGGTWQTMNNTFTPPAGVVSMTLFHLIAGNGTLIIDDVEVSVPDAVPTPDIISPTVSVTAPVALATVSGTTTTLTADATDNIGVTGVTFHLDGVIVGTEDTTAPYSFVWNSTSVVNGEHAVRAVAKDAAGNVATSTVINFTVANSTTTPPSGSNLVVNPGLETPGAAGNPANWNRGGWGTNNRVYTYPVAGVTGNAAQVEITSYTNGDAKWYFDPVAVASSTQYTVGDRYSSTAVTEVLVRYTLVSGTFQYQYLSQLPATAGAWNTFSQVVTTPANATALTLFHVLIGNGRLTVDNAIVYGESVVVPPTDTTLPIVSVTSPIASTTASGTVSIITNATDNVAVASVSLLIDGVVVGIPDTSLPYTFTWDSNLVSNGVHTISARATDTVGNVGNATPISISVNNTIIPPSGSNLVVNPGLETPGAAGNPANWNRGGWGTNDRTFTYPVAGQSGNAARVAITSYSNGDAKWYFDDVPVTPGEQYTFNYDYKATVSTNLTLRYTKTDGTFLYVGMGNVGANANWTSGAFTVVAPADVVSLTVMHILNQVGTLEIDNHSLYSGNTNTFNRGKVTFSFDDGWLEHSTLAAPVLDDAGLKGTFYIVSDEMLGASSSEMLQNPDLEIVGTGGNPANWNRGGWGTNDRTFTYPVAGQSGNAARVAITSYSNGDAKWYFDDVTVLQNTSYSVSGTYQANAGTQLIARYQLVGGTYQYQLLVSLPATSLINWGSYQEPFTTPVNSISVTVFHVLSQVGELTTDSMSLGQTQAYANTAQVLAMQAAGHEIGAHTQSHTSLITLDLAGKTNEIAGSKAELEAAGLNIATIAYPYGDYDDEVKMVTENSGYIAGRSVDRGFNDQLTDHYALKIQQVGRNTSLAQLQAWIDQAEANNSWLILMFHQIDDDPAATLGINEQDYTSLVNYTANADVDVITVLEGVALLNN